MKFIRVKKIVNLTIIILVLLLMKVVDDMAIHMGPEVQNSFKEVTRGDQYGKLTVRHQ